MRLRAKLDIYLDSDKVRIDNSAGTEDLSLSKLRNKRGSQKTPPKNVE
jgi:hypothetical protein